MKKVFLMFIAVFWGLGTISSTAFSANIVLGAGERYSLIHENTELEFICKKETIEVSCACKWNDDETRGIYLYKTKLNTSTGTKSKTKIMFFGNKGDESLSSCNEALLKITYCLKP